MEEKKLERMAQVGDENEQNVMCVFTRGEEFREPDREGVKDGDERDS